MVGKSWYSANLRLATLVEGRGLFSFEDVVVLFRSSGPKRAFRRAMSIGKDRECDYKNVYGKKVRVRLKEVVSLDLVAKSIDGLDGAEIYSDDPRAKVGAIPFHATFRPEKSKPYQTVFGIKV